MGLFVILGYIADWKNMKGDIPIVLFANGNLETSWGICEWLAIA